MVAACLAVAVPGLQGCGKKAPPPVAQKVEKKGPPLPPGLLVYACGGSIWKLPKGQPAEKLVGGSVWFPALKGDETLVAYWEDLGDRMAMNILNLSTKAVTRVGTWNTLGALGRNLNLRNAPVWLDAKNVLLFADGRQIWQVEADGTNLQTIYEHADGGCYSVSPSPDGTRIAFVSVREKDQNLWTYSTLTHKAQPVTEYTNRDGAVGAPAWSPRGDPIVFVLYKSEEANLWRVLSEGGVSMQITREGRTNSPSWDPTGAKLAASSGTQNPMLWHIHLISATDGKFLEQLTNTSPGGFSPSIAGAW
jgi:dipeptidyl aminopeptidase/acylaminoacyl peptidase